MRRRCGLRLMPREDPIEAKMVARPSRVIADAGQTR